MTISIEVTVLAGFIAGLVLICPMLNKSDLAGRHYFTAAFIFLTLSNIFTILEEFFLNAFFNLCEHSSIMLGSIMLFVGVIRLTGKDHRPDCKRNSGGPKRLAS